MSSSGQSLVRVLVVTREVATTVTRLAEQAQVRLSVHICTGALEDAVANARAASPEGGLLAVVEGKNATVGALGAGVDEAIEAHVLTPELLALAVQLATERRKSRREREELERSLAQTAKLAVLGTVVAGVAHEVNNPATMISMQLEYLVRTVDVLRRSLGELEAAPNDPAVVARAVTTIGKALGSERAEQSVRDCQVAIRMIAEVVRDLRVMSHASAEAPPEIVDLRRLIEQTLRLTGVDGDERIHIERDFPDEIPQLWLPRSRVLQIFANLVTNSAFAMRTAPRALKRLRIVVRHDDTTLMIAFMDTGAGISESRLPQLFEPFFTTKGPEHGTGLGLYMSREIVRKLGGDLTLDSVEGWGTTAMVFLPLALQTTSAPERGRELRVKRPRVLIAHDDDEQLLALRRMLSHHYDPLLARGAIEAIDLVASGSRVDGIVCGRFSPSVDGESLPERLSLEWPALARRTVLLDEVTTLAGTIDSARLNGALELRLSESFTHAEP